MNKNIKANGLKEVGILLVMALFIGIYQINLVEQTFKKFSINLSVTNWIGIGVVMQEEVEARKIVMLAYIDRLTSGEKEEKVKDKDGEGDKTNNPALILTDRIDKESLKPKGSNQSNPKNKNLNNSSNLSKPPAIAAQMLSLGANPKCIEECTILLLGDSLMGDIYFSLSRAAKKEGKKWKIIDAHKVSSGLTNSKYYDWPKVAGVLIEQYKPDVIAVLIGANDAQGMMDGNKAYAFGTDNWKQSYKARANVIIEASSKAGANLYWLEMPEVGKSEFEKKIKVIRQIQGEAAADKSFTTYDILGTKTDEGFLTLRQPDGIHLSAQGAGLVAKKLIKHLSNLSSGNTSITTNSNIIN